MDINHLYSFKHCDSIQNICKPFFDMFDITFFRYTHIDDKDRRFMLTNEPDILRYFYEDKQYYFAYIDGRKFEHFSTSTMTWENCAVELNTLLHEEGRKIKKDINEYFDQHHGIIFCKKNKHDLEIFEFAAKTYAIYFHNRIIFDKFFLYFKDAARKHIIQASKEKIILPNCNLKVVINSEKNFMDALRLQDVVKTKHYYLSGEYKDIYLTRKEILCCYFAYKGKDASEIAKILNISRRTVEKHFNHCYSKLGVNSKLSLLSLLAQELNLEAI